MAHRWKETGEIHGPDRRTETAFRKAVALSGIDRLILWPEGGLHEQGVSVRVDGTREVKAVNEPADGWITGTDDFQWWLFDELWIDDLKTGKFYPHPDNPEVNRFPQDVRSPQMQLYALAMCEVLQYNGPVHVSVTHWPRLPVSRRHSLPTRDFVQFDSGWLRSIYWSSLEQLYIDGKEGTKVVPGEHCRFCPSNLFCIERE